MTPPVCTGTLSSVHYAFYAHADHTELAADLGKLLQRLGNEPVSVEWVKQHEGQAKDPGLDLVTPPGGGLTWFRRANHDCIALLTECHEEKERWPAWVVEAQAYARASTEHAYGHERALYLDLAPFPTSAREVRGQARRHLAGVVTGAERLDLTVGDGRIALARADGRTWVVVAPEDNGGEAAAFLLTLDRGLLLPSLLTAAALRRGAAAISETLHRLDESRATARLDVWRREANDVVSELEPWLQRARGDAAVAASLRQAPQEWKRELNALVADAERLVAEASAAAARAGASRSSSKRQFAGPESASGAPDSRRLRMASRNDAHDAATSISDGPSRSSNPTDLSEPGASAMVTVAFLSIVEFKALDAETGHAAMAALHAVLRASLGPRPHSGPSALRVLSCLTGAIVLVPDDLGADALDLLAGAMQAIAAAGVAVRIGVAHGRVEMVEDADGTLNAVGVCINVSARIANWKGNACVLAHESFASIAGVLRAPDHWLYPAPGNATLVPGKAHDEPFRCYASRSGDFAVLDRCTIRSSSVPRHQVAVMLAYDLPKFSGGDGVTLASRFRGIVQGVQRLRLDGRISSDVDFSFSPGGDGAILAFTKFNPGLAHDLADHLVRLLGIESSLRVEEAGVDARIALHYGPVLLYENAEGRYRPTGPTLFDADDLASDDEAKARKAVVVSGALIESVAHGSRRFQEAEFEEIGKLVRPHGRELRRFVRRARREPAMPASPAPDSSTDPRPSPASLPETSIASTLPRCWNVPERNRLFTGRADLLENIGATLNHEKAHSRRVVLHGLGGIGKTQTALEFAYRNAHHYDVVWWVHTAERSALIDGLAGLSRALRLPVTNPEDEQLLVEAAQSWLRRNGRWLVVLDDVSAPDELTDPLIPTGLGHVLITSRNANWTRWAAPLPVAPLELNEAAALLSEGTSSSARAALEELAEELGKLPLALEQARAYIEAAQISVPAYLALFHRKKLWLLSQGPPSPDYPYTVATTWAVSFDALKNQSTAAVGLLNLCAFFAPHDIPRLLLGGGWDHVPTELSEAAKDAIVFDEAIVALRRYSLVNATSESLLLHPLVQTIVRERLDVGDRRRWASAAISVAHLPFVHTTEDGDSGLRAEDVGRRWRTYARWLPHALASVQHADELGIEGEDVACLFRHIGNYLHERADVRGAVRALERALTLREAAGTPEQIVAVCVELGNALLDLGDTDGALARYERARALAEATWGRAHRHSAALLHALARYKRRVGDLKGALSCFEGAKEIDLANHGPQDKSVGRDLVNIGAVLHDMGDLVSAAAMFESALPILEATYGCDHPELAVVHQSRGIVARDLGDPNAACEHFERALLITQSAYGADDPRVAELEESLAQVLCGLRRIPEAIVRAEHAFRVTFDRFGPAHAAVARSAHALALGHWLAKNLENARKYFEHALVACESVYGVSSSQVASELSNLAGVAEDQVDLYAALAYAERAAEIDRKATDKSDPQMRIRARVLGSIRTKLARRGQA